MYIYIYTYIYIYIYKYIYIYIYIYTYIYVSVFCFWVKPKVSKIKRITDVPTTALIASPKNNKAACAIM
jgi:hypothetical protein